MSTIPIIATTSEPRLLKPRCWAPHGELLIKNHHKRPVDLALLPEVHNVQKKAKNNKFNGPAPMNKPGQHKHNRKQRPNSHKWKRDNARPKKDNKCHRCGDFLHFAKNCRTPKHLVALYQKSLKESKQAGDTRYESHFSLASEATPEVGCSTQAQKNKQTTRLLKLKRNFHQQIACS